MVVVCVWGGVSNKNEYFQLAGFYPQQGTETTRHLGSRYLISCSAAQGFHIKGRIFLQREATGSVGGATTRGGAASLTCVALSLTQVATVLSPSLGHCPCR